LAGVGVFGSNMASVAMKMFSHVIYFITTLYKFCTFNAICEDNAAINCIIVQHKKGSFSSVLTDCSVLTVYITNEETFD
jgi:hypothetical protein